MEVKPIAYFHSQKKHPFDAARQATADLSQEIGEIHFLPGAGFEQALEDVEGFSHLWLIYQFHHNPNWKPKVLPPRGSDRKVGVFATRSPYRPNPLGLSCVQLVGRSGLVLKVKNFDLLDGTPIFDLKPYVSYADSFPEAKMGWLENVDQEKLTVRISPLARVQIGFLAEHGVPELENFLHQQLSFDPLNSQKKRVHILSENQAVIAYRTWRAQFSTEGQQVSVHSIFSGYSDEDLKDPADPYQDKDLHRAFKASAHEPSG